MSGDENARQRLPELTARQYHVARMLANDMCIKETAAELGISPKTVEYHWAQVKRRLGVRTYVGLVLAMVKRGAVS